MRGLEVRWEIYVCADRLDPFLTYRLIEPAYQMFNEVSIVERNIENFDERVICDFKHTDNSCMNCHTHGQQRGDAVGNGVRGHPSVRTVRGVLHEHHHTELPHNGREENGGV